MSVTSHLQLPRSEQRHKTTTPVREDLLGDKNYNGIITPSNFDIVNNKLEKICMAKVSKENDDRKAFFNNVFHPPLFTVTGADNQKMLGYPSFFQEHNVFIAIHAKLVKEFGRNVFETPEDGKIFLDEWMSSPGVNISRTIIYNGYASFDENNAHEFIKNINNLAGKLMNSLLAI